MMTLLAVGLFAVFAFAGYRRGAVKITGLLAAMLLSLIVAPPFGRAIEGVVASITNSGGVVNRLISIAIAGALVIGAAGFLFSLAATKLAKRFVEDEEKWRRADRLAGLAIGGIEGLLIILMLGWTALMLEPVASSRLASDESAGLAPHPVAAKVRRTADEVRSSFLGSLAKATMPEVGTELMSLASDFAAISRDREALEYFTSTPVMKRLSELPSVKDAQRAIENDPALSGSFSERGIDAQGIRRILESNTLLDVLDRTSIASDFKPLVADLKAAIAEAKRRIKPAAPADEPPSETR